MSKRIFDKLILNNISVVDTSPYVIASDYNEIQQIQPSDSVSGDYFGVSVSMNATGNTAVVGAYEQDGAEEASGAAYIFNKNGSNWSQTQKIQGSDAGEDSSFGFAVSVNSEGDKVIVGAKNQYNSGAAYIFGLTSDTWDELQKIEASDVTSYSEFGNSVVMNSEGNIAIIGAFREDTGGSNSGAAYIFKEDGGSFTEVQKLKPSDIQSNANFGVSVSMNSEGNIAAIGSNKADNGGTSQGAAYIFKDDGNDNWSQYIKLLPSDIEDNDQFGSSVALNSNGDIVLIGSPTEDTGGSNVGAAYIFREDLDGNWNEIQKIQASDKQSLDVFGYSVSINSNGNLALISSWSNDTGGSQAGAAYVFTTDQSGIWNETQKIQASDKQAGDYFGHSCSMDSTGDNMIIGAIRTGSSGSAYLFEGNTTLVTSSGTVTKSELEPNELYRYKDEPEGFVLINH